MVQLLCNQARHGSNENRIIKTSERTLCPRNAQTPLRDQRGLLQRTSAASCLRTSTSTRTTPFRFRRRYAGTHRVSSIRVAEAAKVIEKIQRDAPKAHGSEKGPALG